MASGRALLLLTPHEKEGMIKELTDAKVLPQYGYIILIYMLLALSTSLSPNPLLWNNLILSAGLHAFRCH